jgi:hypothetical protein
VGTTGMEMVILTIDRATSWHVGAFAENGFASKGEWDESTASWNSGRDRGTYPCSARLWKE